MKAEIIKWCEQVAKDYNLTFNYVYELYNFYYENYPSYDPEELTIEAIISTKERWRMGAYD